jgi:NADPH:quinone reductase-like Zn-dependent oxidoreductase
MKAAVIHSHGGVEAVKVEDISEPKVGDNDVVLQVRSVSLNHLDIWVRNGGRSPAMEMPHILGSDAAGIVAKSVKKITNDRGVDIVFDTVGAQAWETDFTIIKKGGRIVLCGVTSGAKTKTNLQSLYWRQVTVIGSTMGSSGDFQQMLKTVTAAKLKPVVDSVYPLNNIQKTMGWMEKGKQFGKIVLTVSK